MGRINGAFYWQLGDVRVCTPLIMTQTRHNSGGDNGSKPLSLKKTITHTNPCATKILLCYSRDWNLLGFGLIVLR